MSISPLEQKDMLHEVFKFLPIPDLKNVAQVSKLWKHITCSQLLWKQLLIRDKIPFTQKIYEDWKQTYLTNSGLFTRLGYRIKKVEHPQTMTAICIEGDKLYLGDIKGNIRILSFKSLKNLHSIKLDKYAIISLGFHKKDLYVSILFPQCSSKLSQYDGNASEEKNHKIFTLPLTIVCIDENRVICQTFKNCYLIENTSNFESKIFLFESDSKVYIHNGNVFEGTKEGDLKCYTALKKNETKHITQSHSKKITAMAAQGGALFTSSEDRTIKVWDCQTWSCLYSFQTSGVVNRMQVFGRQIVTIEDGSVFIYDFSKNKVNDESNIK